MRMLLAFRAFFAILFNAQLASDVDRIMTGETPAIEPPTAQQPTPPPAAKPPTPVRSDAITLIATLQREARFIDIVKEPLGDYSDEQIGAAARDVLREAAG